MINEIRGQAKSSETFNIWISQIYHGNIPQTKRWGEKHDFHLEDWFSQYTRFVHYIGQEKHTFISVFLTSLSNVRLLMYLR